MKVEKPSEQDKAYFRDLFEAHPELEIKPMFGNMGAFVRENQQMCAGLFGSSIGIRLADGDRASLAAVAGAGPFGPEGRPMKEYVALPPQWRTGSDDLDDWIDRAVTFTQTLPPKKKKAKNKA